MQKKKEQNLYGVPRVIADQVLKIITYFENTNQMDVMETKKYVYSYQ